MSKYKPVEEIPERGNGTFIDAASWRSLMIESGCIPNDSLWNAIAGLIMWQYTGKDKEKIAEELRMDDMLRKELYFAIERQERFNKAARERQQVSRYRGFKTNLERRCKRHSISDIKTPSQEEWVAMGAPGVDEFLDRALNGEFGEAVEDGVRQLREMQEEAAEQ